ncbi:hypothetical protein, partial [Escherichia coli]
AHFVNWRYIFIQLGEVTMTPGRNRYEAPDSLSKPIVESNDTPANSTQFTLEPFSIFKWDT